MNQARRVVVCIGAGVFLVIVAAVVCGLVVGAPDGGWFMYSPGNSQMTVWSEDDSQVWKQVVVWLLALASWVGFSWWLFGDRND